MSLRHVLTEETLAELRDALAAGAFPGISLKHAIEFLRSEGIVPASGLPVESFLRLEEWARAVSDFPYPPEPGPAEPGPDFDDP